MEKSKCLQAIRVLEKKSEERPSPEDVLINIAETCKDLDLGEAGWANFYAYITCNDRENWEYKPKSELKTLGDLTEDEWGLIEIDLEKKANDRNVIHKVFENGIETFVETRYIRDEEDEKKEE